MSNSFKNIALIVAGGSGTRLSKELPKQYLKINNQTTLEICINKFLAHKEIDAVAVVISKDHQDLYNKYIPKHEKLLPPIFGGKRRQDSVRLGLDSIKKNSPKNVLIHDAARILLDPNYIDKLIKALDTKQAVCLVMPANDTMRYIDKNGSKIVSRETLFAIQTPQGFHYNLIRDLHHKFQDIDFTDDISFLEHEGITDIEYIKSPMTNFKITTQQDYELAKNIMQKNMITKVGMGFDAHKFNEKPNTSIMLCGIKLPCNYEVIAHSDGDVALHALTDALLGTISEGDIGQHFPPSDPKLKNASSDQFVKFASELIKKKGGVINNIDLTIISETPRIGPHRDKMQKQLANILGIDLSTVNIKATTTEGMGFTGRREGIACQAVVSVCFC